MTIREAIRAYIDEQGAALDVEWMLDYLLVIAEEELNDAGFEFDDEQCTWTKPQ